MRPQTAYTTTVVLIRCPGCQAIHLIADNLGWFEDKPVNVEELVRRASGEEAGVFAFTREDVEALTGSARRAGTGGTRIDER